MSRLRPARVAPRHFTHHAYCRVIDISITPDFVYFPPVSAVTLITDAHAADAAACRHADTLPLISIFTFRRSPPIFTPALDAIAAIRSIRHYAISCRFFRYHDFRDILIAVFPLIRLFDAGSARTIFRHYADVC